VVDVEEAEGDGEEDSVLGEAGVSFSCGQCGKRLLRETSEWLDDRLTVGERTEKADTTIAFNPSLMRRDHTNNSEMLKMKISNAIAVISIPRHKFHCSKSVSWPVS
jgi:hypothetical protein